MHVTHVTIKFDHFAKQKSTKKTRLMTSPHWKMAYLTARLGLRTSYWRSAACLRLYSNSAKQTEGIVRKEGEEQGLERVTPDELVGRQQRHERSLLPTKFQGEVTPMSSTVTSVLQWNKCGGVRTPYKVVCRKKFAECPGTPALTLRRYSNLTVRRS